MEAEWDLKVALKCLLFPQKLNLCLWIRIHAPLTEFFDLLFNVVSAELPEAEFNVFGGFFDIEVARVDVGQELSVVDAVDDGLDLFCVLNDAFAYFGKQAREEAPRR